MKRIQCLVLLFAVLFVCSCSGTPGPAETQDIAAILDAAAENGGGVVSRNDGIFKNYENTASGVIVRNMTQTPYGVCLMYCPVGDGIFRLPEQFIENVPINSVDEFAFFRERDQSVNMRELYIPDTYRKISTGAFAFCEKLEKVHLGRNVDFVESGAFNGSNSIKQIVVDPENETFISESGCLIDVKEQKVVFAFGKAEIPEGVKTIGASSFANSDDCPEIEIPSGVTCIQRKAFAYSKVKRIYINAADCTVESNAFDGCSDVVIYCAAKEKPDAWSDDWLAGCTNPTVVWDYKNAD